MSNVNIEISPNDDFPYLELESFENRHLGSNEKEINLMLNILGYSDIDSFISDIIPANILLNNELSLPKAISEHETLEELKKISLLNKVFKSYIGMGYNPCILPPVIQRNILENPGWYTAYTPYQAEIAQGRLEALLNFQTMISELTGMEISNASLLDEATSAAEAMYMLYNLRVNQNSNKIFVSETCFPQTIDVIQTRATPLNINVEIGDLKTFKPNENYFAILFQYPDSNGEVSDFSNLISEVNKFNIKSIVATDLLSLSLLIPPGEWGADVVIGTNQRFGLPLGFGGPHAGYFATKDIYKRNMPGRLVGVSKDKNGNNALRLALQTREQHIRRDKATSNICTAQVLLAVISSMYAVYHGPQGIMKIALRIHALTNLLKNGILKLGHEIISNSYFDTLNIKLKNLSADDLRKYSEEHKVNFRIIDHQTITISLNETTNLLDLDIIFKILNNNRDPDFSSCSITFQKITFPEKLIRKTSFLQQKVFNSYHTETEILRYMHKLESKDLSLNTSMISLGSCTMKLNATTEMIPVTWEEFSGIHPFAPRNQTIGYHIIFEKLESWLCEITGFSAVSLQPNAGSQGEYAGLLAIRNYHLSKNHSNRNICLIPISAHGTNPASAVLAGFKVVVINCDTNGNIDITDLIQKVNTHKDNLGALMITYPSTHGVFEENVKEICKIIHDNGGLVYMDGANMNAQVGLTKPSEIGADVCHLNLHKTFCIPHGGGGPGVGPIGVNDKLKNFLPGHSQYDNNSGNTYGAVSASPYGSANILLISYAYIRMLGSKGLKKATQLAILNANYIAKKLSSKFPILYKGKNNLVAHECILDTRKFKNSAGIEVEDIAKRLMDYGFHSPTMSFPVPGTLMVEPTESESLNELDRFIETMLNIYEEIKEIEEGKYPRDNNVLKNAPHTTLMIVDENWNSTYTREKAAFALPFLRTYKFWPNVARIDNVYGDRNLVCSCDPLESYI
jgi:glycine dehydrogenase